MSIPRPIRVVLVSAIWVLLAAEQAAAQNFGFLGHWRVHCCSQVGIGPPVFPTTMTVTSTPEAYGKNGILIRTLPLLGGGIPAKGAAQATVAGSAPASIMIPSKNFQLYVGPATHYINSSFTYFRTTWAIKNPGWTLKKGGGIGNLSWCAGKAGCATPAGGVSPSKHNGRFVIKKGVNQFGGSARMLGVNSGRVKFHIGGKAGGSTRVVLDFNFPPDWGALNAAGTAVYSKVNKNQQYILLPGGTMTPGGPAYFKRTAAGVTTGAVHASATRVTAPFKFLSVTQTGYDKRTAMGVGKIVLVGPQMSHEYTTKRSFPHMTRLRLNMAPEPGRLSLIAFGVAALLALGHWRVMRRN